jgi:DNA-binding LacI/PurR family transcriptional regulator
MISGKLKLKRKPAAGKELEPAYGKFKRILVEDIRSGIFSVGDKLPSRNELQRQFNISCTTYHKAIDEMILNGMLRTHKGKGVFVQSKYSRHDPMENTVTLLVTMPSFLEHLAFTELINGILDIIVPQGYNLKFTFFNPLLLSEEEMKEKLARIGSAGVIIPYDDNISVSHLQGLAASVPPVVFLGRSFSEISGLLVETDSQKAIENYIDTLKLKSLSIAYIGQPFDNFYRRHLGFFEAACTKRNIRICEVIHKKCIFSQREGANAMAELLQEYSKLPELIIADDDYVAIGIISVLQKKQINREILVVGGFLKHLFPLSDYPIIDLNYRQSGREAAILLLNQLTHGAELRHTIVESEFLPGDIRR